MRGNTNSGRLAVLTIATICMAVAIGSVSAPCPTGTISYWQLDETSGITANDYFGTYDGTLKPSGFEPTWTTSGQVNGALSFDGIDDYVDCGDITELNSVSAFTVLGWYKDDNIGGHNRHFDKGDGWDHDISGATYSGRLYIEVGNGANTYAYWTGYSTVISPGEWYHAAFVFDGSGATNADKAKIYVNGVERSLNFGGGSMPSSTANLAGYPFTISKAGTVNPWDGDIDEVAIFNRALSVDEIWQLYKKSLGGYDYCVSPRIFIDPPMVTVEPCQEFTVNIDIADVADLFYWDLKISFDPTLVECLDVTEGPFLQSAGPTVFTIGEINNVIGYVHFSCTMFPGFSATGSGTLALVTFHCLGPGDNDLHLYDTSLFDHLPGQIPHNIDDGFVSQQLSPPPVGGVWLTINKTELLTPWITLASLVTITVVSVVYVKHKRKQRY